MKASPRRRSAEPAPAPAWLLMVHQLPPKPAYLRVKIWRRLQGLGAVALKNSVYALPASDQAREDFQWLLGEIGRGGGDGVICESRVIAGMSDEQVRGLFDAARDADYGAVAQELRKLAAAAKRGGPRGKAAEVKSAADRLRRRLAEIGEIDFFGATGRLTTAALLREVDALAAAAEPAPAPRPVETPKPEALSGKVWVTRRGVHIDRIACAWLIRRFIDGKARFKFVAGKDYAAKPGELRFDMFQAEFTHEGDRCTFEVMLKRLRIDDAALGAIGEIVHDLDLKDGKFGRAQTAGIAQVIAGICLTLEDDLARVERGGALFDDMYEAFRRRR